MKQEAERSKERTSLVNKQRIEALQYRNAEEPHSESEVLSTSPLKQSIKLPPQKQSSLNTRSSQSHQLDPKKQQPLSNSQIDDYGQLILSPKTDLGHQQSSLKEILLQNGQLHQVSQSSQFPSSTLCQSKGNYRNLPNNRGLILQPIDSNKLSSNKLATFQTPDSPASKEIKQEQGSTYNKGRIDKLNVFRSPEVAASGTLRNEANERSKSLMSKTPTKFGSTQASELGQSSKLASDQREQAGGSVLRLQKLQLGSMDLEMIKKELKQLKKLKNKSKNQLLLGKDIFGSVEQKPSEYLSSIRSGGLQAIGGLGIKEAQIYSAKNMFSHQTSLNDRSQKQGGEQSTLTKARELKSRNLLGKSTEASIAGGGVNYGLISANAGGKISVSQPVKGTKQQLLAAQGAYGINIALNGLHFQNANHNKDIASNQSLIQGQMDNLNKQLEDQQKANIQLVHKLIPQKNVSKNIQSIAQNSLSQGKDISAPKQQQPVTSQSFTPNTQPLIFPELKNQYQIQTVKAKNNQFLNNQGHLSEDEDKKIHKSSSRPTLSKKQLTPQVESTVQDIQNRKSTIQIQKHTKDRLQGGQGPFFQEQDKMRQSWNRSQQQQTTLGGMLNENSGYNSRQGQVNGELRQSRDQYYGLSELQPPSLNADNLARRLRQSTEETVKKSAVTKSEIQLESFDQDKKQSSSMKDQKQHAPQILNTQSLTAAYQSQNKQLMEIQSYSGTSSPLKQKLQQHWLQVNRTQEHLSKQSEEHSKVFQINKSNQDSQKTSGEKNQEKREVIQNQSNSNQPRNLSQDMLQKVKAQFLGTKWTAQNGKNIQGNINQQAQINQQTILMNKAKARVEENKRLDKREKNHNNRQDASKIANELREEQSNGILKIGQASKQGQSSFMNKVNQDRFIIKHKLCGVDNLYLLAVADGHGTNGHLVSKHIKQVLANTIEFEDKRLVMSKFSNQVTDQTNSHQKISSIFSLPEEEKKQFQSLVRQLLSKAFNSVNKQIESQRSFDVHMSGSTLVAAIISPQYVVTANCGDSRCIIISDQGKVILQTSDQKPNRPDERQRIENQYKGRVRRQGELNGDAKLLNQNQLEDQPYRVWAMDVDLPGLAMSRSIGDSMAKPLGVIAEPEIQVFDFQETQTKSSKNSPTNNQETKFKVLPSYIALASDGIWDVQESEQLAQLILQSQYQSVESAKSKAPKEIASQIVADAHSLWEDMDQIENRGINLPRNYKPEIDDITFVLGQFKFQSKDQILLKSETQEARQQ